MDVQEAAILCADPQAAVAVAKQNVNVHLSWKAWQRVLLGLCADDSLKAVACTNEQRAISALVKGSDAVQHPRHRLKHRWTWLPSKDAVLHAYPEIAAAVLVETQYSQPEPAASFLAPSNLFLNRAERPALRSRSS